MLTRAAAEDDEDENDDDDNGGVLVAVVVVVVRWDGDLVFYFVLFICVCCSRCWLSWCLCVERRVPLRVFISLFVFDL